MNKDEILLSKIVPHNRDYFSFTSKFLKRSWKDGAEQEKPFADNYESSCLFVWPPRNYTCNFCDREFRSAQALGGHMNVHRRDRARLQEAVHDPNYQDEDHDHTHERICNSSAVNGSEKAVIISPRVCDISCNSNPSDGSLGFLKSDEREDDMRIVSAKRRRVDPLIEPQHDKDVLDLELRL